MSFILLLFVSLVAEASFLPPNNLSMPLGPGPAFGLSETQFNVIIKKVSRAMARDVRLSGARVILHPLWESPLVNAGTWRENGDWHINLYGGMARHQYITTDAFALVICHEYGHHLGGAPKKKYVSWASTEGEADYFATLKCFRKVFAGEKHPRPGFVPGRIKRLCLGDPLCIRAATAAQAIAKVMAATQNERPPSIYRVDSRVVRETYEKHPEAQCRLDTYLQGALCPASVNVPLSNKSEEQGACYSLSGMRPGDRPRCWFRKRK